MSRALAGFGKADMTPLVSSKRNWKGLGFGPKKSDPKAL